MAIVKLCGDLATLLLTCKYEIYTTMPEPSNGDRRGHFHWAGTAASESLPMRCNRAKSFSLDCGMGREWRASVDGRGPEIYGY